MKVLLAEPRGFCAGVEMAIKALAWMVRIFDPPIYCYHQIVHNEYVVSVFERNGVVFVSSIEEVPDGAVLMLSAHGSAPDVVSAAERRASISIDAVCPLVTKVHREARRYSNQRRHILYVGKKNHDEAVGVLGEVALGGATLIEPTSGLGDLTFDGESVALLAQTTLALQDWSGVLEEALERFPEIELPRKNDVCYATTNRQEAVAELVGQAQLILVVGSENSSNTKALVSRAEALGCRAYRVDRADQIRPEWLEGVQVVGLTSGASVPDNRVYEILDSLAPDEVETLSVAEEGEYFPLPPQLRGLIREQFPEEEELTAAQVLRLLEE